MDLFNIAKQALTPPLPILVLTLTNGTQLISGVIEVQDEQVQLINPRLLTAVQRGGNVDITIKQYINPNVVVSTNFIMKKTLIMSSHIPNNALLGVYERNLTGKQPTGKSIDSNTVTQTEESDNSNNVISVVFRKDTLNNEPFQTVPENYGKEDPDPDLPPIPA